MRRKKDTKREELCKSSRIRDEHQRRDTGSSPPLENRLAYNKLKRLPREIAFLQTEAFDVAASPFRRIVIARVLGEYP